MQKWLFIALAYFLAFAALGLFVVRERRFGALLILTGFVLAAAQGVSRVVLNHDLDFFIFMRLDWDMLHMAPAVMFGSAGFFLVIVMVVLVFAALRFSGRLEPPRPRRSVRLALGVICVASIVVSPLSRVYVNMMRTRMDYDKVRAGTEDELFAALGLSGRFVPAAELCARPGRNLVVVYCESLESGLLDRAEFPDAMPNLHRLIDSGWTCYTDYQCVAGATWTIGALYATQTSLPAFLGHVGNDYFAASLNNRLPTLGKVLRAAGYDCRFFAGCRLDFSSTGDLLQMLGYKIDDIAENDDPGEKTVWGVHDRDLFKQARDEYVKLSTAGRPFCLTMLTVDTHFPKGLPDSQMASDVSPTIKPMSHEYCYASLDALLGEFIDFIKAQPKGLETAIVVLGDHLLMGSENNTRILRRLKKSPRRVMLLFNSDCGKAANQPIAFYDLPGMILRAAGVEHNAVFLDSLAPRISPEYIETHSAALTALNLKLHK